MPAQAHRLAGLLVGASVLVGACATTPTLAPASSVAATGSPPSPAEVLTRWVAPESLSKVPSHTLTLSATAPSATVRELDFHGRGSRFDAELFLAAQPSPTDVWSWEADLVADGF